MAVEKTQPRSLSWANQRHLRRYHGTSERYTPTWLLDRIATFLGPDYYDPCPARGDRPLTTNGLAESWRGRSVYVNPPYGTPIGSWVVKSMTEPVHEAILLMPSYTDTKWFTSLFTRTLCFVHRRLRFRHPDGHEAETPAPSVLVYRGRRYRQFADAFEDLGPILRTYRPMRPKQPILLDQEVLP